MFSSVKTNNLNWEILTKNLVTFKDKIGLRMKDFYVLIFLRFTEKSNF